MVTVSYRETVGSKEVLVSSALRAASSSIILKIKVYCKNDPKFPNFSVSFHKKRKLYKISSRVLTKIRT